ncbi:hypothetical protein V2W45_1401960 [Cenococcum geophilum]
MKVINTYQLLLPEYLTPIIPVLGNLHQMSPDNFHLALQKLGQEYGPVMSLKLGSQAYNPCGRKVSLGNSATILIF